MPILPIGEDQLLAQALVEGLVWDGLTVKWKASVPYRIAHAPRL